METARAVAAGSQRRGRKVVRAPLQLQERWRRRRRRARAVRDVPVLFASLGSAGHDARLSAPQPRASCLHESRLIGQRAPPFKTTSSPGHWMQASCILSSLPCPLGAASGLIHSNRTTRGRLLRRQNTESCLSLKPIPRTALAELRCISKDFGEVALRFPQASASGVRKVRSSSAALPSAPAARHFGRPSSSSCPGKPPGPFGGGQRSTCAQL